MRSHKQRMPRTLARQAAAYPVGGPAGGDLTVSDELAVALHTIDDFGRSIQGADAKSGALAAVLGLMIGGLVNDAAGSGGRLLTADHVTGATAGPPFVIFVLALLGAGITLAMTQVPRLTVGPVPCRLAFPSVARFGAVPGMNRSNGPGLTAEAWQQVEVLAAIAMIKFRYLRLALFTTSISVLAFLAWFSAVLFASR